MARIRSIKPDFWTDEKVVELSPWERLLFIGLWNFADDQGFIDDKPRRIKMQVFPGDDMSVADVEKMVGNLVAVGVLEEHQSPIGPVLHVRNWERHQRVDRPSQPRFDVDSLTPRRALAESSQTASEPRNGAPVADSPDVAVPPAIRGSGNGAQSGTPDTEGQISTSPRRALDEPSRPSLDAEGKGREGKGVNTPSTSSPRRARTTADPDFERFWAAYPRKVDKGHARKAWKAATEKASPDQITAAAAQYAQTVRSSEARFIAHAATWLNGERWTDQAAITRPPAVGSPNGGAFWDN